MARSGFDRLDEPDRTGPLSAWSDEDLFAEIRRGSERHFNALYERFFQRIYNFVFLRVRNHADAEELTQETFTAVFRSAEGFSGRSTPLGWIYGIAKNTTYNHLRKLRVHGQRLEEAGHDSVAPRPGGAFTHTPEDQLEAERTIRRMSDRLEGLSEWQTEVFYLRHVENLPIREISRRTQRSSDAIRSGLYRVKRELFEATGLESVPEKS